MNLEDANIGAYLQVYKNREGTENTLRYFRRSYPDSPLLLVSDNGDNFSDLADKYQCYYFHDRRGMGLNCIDYYKVLILISRLELLASIMSNTSAILLLEDDVWVKKPLVGKFNSCFAGPWFGNTITVPMANLLKEFGKNIDPNMQFGCSGGTIINTLALLDFLDDCNIDSSFSSFLHKAFKQSIPMQSIDYCLSVMLMFFGAEYSKLECLGEIQKTPGCICDDRYCVIHQVKNWNVISENLSS